MLALNLSGPQSLFKYQSGRVIALGRVMLSSLFLLSIWLDNSQSTQTPARAYALLLVYVLLALGIAAVTWRNWWLDARLAAPCHLLDMAVFTGIIFSTNGYTSPFFLFFILPLLSAAIRWGWRETMLTAIALVLLYLAAGLLVAGTHEFELQRFIVRSGHLVILSAVLIWFGIHQQFTRLFGVSDLEHRLGRDEDPLIQALQVTADAARARSGALLFGSGDEGGLVGVRLSADLPRAIKLDGPIMLEGGCPIMLFSLGRNRGLSQRSNGSYRFPVPSKTLGTDALRELGAFEGFVTEVSTGTRDGWLVLWDIPGLSVDFLELGLELGRVAGHVLDRETLLSTMEESAAARERLSLARDVHDSVVQFLAGAAFRVEAMMRGAGSRKQIESDLKELKRLLIEEQGEIRVLVSALRRDRELDLAEATEELKALARRLGQQWSVDCSVNAREDQASIPIRLQLDLQNLLREAVANAVRHGGASRIDVDVAVEDGGLRLEVTDNGSGFLPRNGSRVEPWSLRERIELANGSLSLVSKPGCTNVSITLPLARTCA